MSDPRRLLAPSAEFEARLFEAAEDLLGARRERVAARQGRAAQPRSGFRMLAAISRFPSSPSFQLSALAALLLAAIELTLSRPGRRLTIADLPEIPKSNDAGARYESLRLKEITADSKEVENARRETQGGA
jgi:hypothetical protein